MRERFLYGAVFIAGIAFGMGLAACGPEPTTAVYTDQRKTALFHVLTYEVLETSTDHVDVMLFEDAAQNCYITSGQDGGVQLAPLSACAAARQPEALEK